MLTFRRPAVALLVLLTLWPTLVLAQEKAGIVTTLEGNVTATRVVLPQPVPLKFKDDVFLRDKVTTGDRSLVRLLLGGKAIVTVRERSTLTITEIPGRSIVELDSGKVGLAVARDRMRPGEVIDIRTPNAIIAVRGTVLVAEVSRVTAQAGGATPPAVTSSFYLLRGSAEAQARHPQTGMPIGTPFALSVLQSFRVTGTSAPVIASIPPEAVGQVTSGLQPKGHQHSDAANGEQVKGQLLDATSSMITALTGGTSGGTEVNVVAAAQAIADTTTLTPTTTTAPIIPPITSTIDQPEISVTGLLFLDPGQTLVSFSGTTTRTSTAPYASIGAPLDLTALSSLEGVDFDTMTEEEALAFLAAVGFTAVVQLGTDNLIEVLPGANVSLASSLLRVQNAAVIAGHNLLNVQGALVSPGASPVIDVDPSFIEAAADLIFVGPTGALTLGGPLLKTFDSSINAGGNILQISGGVINAANTLLQFTSSDVMPDNSLIRIVNGGRIVGSGTAPLVVFDDAFYEGGLGFGSVTGGSLLRMFSSTGQAGTGLTLNGPYLTAVNSDIFGTDSPLFNIADGATITSTTTLPFAAFQNSDVNSASTFFNVDTNTSFTIPGQPTTVGSGGPVSIAINGALIDGIDSFFSTANDGSFVRLHNGVTLTQSGAQPLVLFNASAPGGTNVLVAGNFLNMGASSGQPAPTLVLAGGLLDAVNSYIQTSSKTGVARSFAFIADGSQVTVTNDEPFIRATNTMMYLGGDVVGVRRSRSGTPSRLTLNGPLFVGNNSSVSTSSFGFGATFGVTNSACCTSFFIAQGGQLKGTSTADLIRLVNSTFSSGPDIFSGGDFFGVVDTFSGAPSSELVAPATVSIAGRLVSLDTSTLTALFNGLTVIRSSFTSTTPNALIEAMNSSLQFGGPDPTQGFATTLGRILQVVGAGGPGSTTFATVTLNGPVLSATNSTLNLTGGLISVFSGGRLIAAGAGDLATIIGGSHSIGTLTDTDLFFFGGRSAVTTSEVADGVTVVHGTDQPIQTARTLLSASDATITTNRFGAFFDNALFQATAPIFNMTSSTFNVGSDALRIQSTKLTTPGPLVALNASILSSAAGAILNLSTNGLLQVSGDLFSLANGSTLRTLNGPLIRIANNSVLNVAGALAIFLGTGSNTINVTNSLCLGAGGCSTFAGIPVYCVGGCSTNVSIAKPLKNPAFGSLVNSPSAAVIYIDGTSKVTITGN